MGRKKKKDKELIWCWYCDRMFEDNTVLIDHQRAKHYKCQICNKKLNMISSLLVHAQQVHKTNITKVPNAIKGRDTTTIEIFGMEGVPEDDLEAKRIEMRGGEPPAKKPKVEEADVTGLPPGVIPAVPGVAVVPAPFPAAPLPPGSIPGAPYPGAQAPPGMPPYGAPPPMRPMGPPGMVPPHMMPPHLRPPGAPGAVPPPGMPGAPPPLAVGRGAPPPGVGMMPPGGPPPPHMAPPGGPPTQPLFPVQQPATAQAPAAPASAPVANGGTEAKKPGTKPVRLVFSLADKSMEEERAAQSRYRYDPTTVQSRISSLDRSIESRLSSLSKSIGRV
eukprot:Rmarinus@m.27491